MLGKGQVVRPNGIALSPDNQVLYVADTDTRPGGSRLLLVFEVGEDGMPSKRQVLHDFGAGVGADGPCVDVEGYLYATARFR